jgi:hypothetical protein
LIDKILGTVTEWRHNDISEPDEPLYSPKDPRSWRNTCGETRKLNEMLNEWRDKFESLHWVAYIERVWDDEGLVRDRDTERCEELQAIIREHGWPGEFRREECQEVLNAWCEEHQDEPYGG